MINVACYITHSYKYVYFIGTKQFAHYHAVAHNLTIRHHMIMHGMNNQNISRDSTHTESSCMPSQVQFLTAFNQQLQFYVGGYILH